MPAWLVLVGVVALWLPPPTIAMGTLLLLVTVVFVPALAVTVDGRTRMRGTADLAPVTPRARNRKPPPARYVQPR